MYDIEDPALIGRRERSPDNAVAMQRKEAAAKRRCRLIEDPGQKVMTIMEKASDAVVIYAEIWWIRAL
jgi:hypothetical protein